MMLGWHCGEGVCFDDGNIDSCRGPRKDAPFLSLVYEALDVDPQAGLYNPILTFKSNLEQ